MKPPNPNNIPVSQYSTKTAASARLVALIEGLGVEHAASWLGQPVKAFYDLGEAFKAKTKATPPEPKPSAPEAVKPVEKVNDTTEEKSVTE